MLLGNPCDSAEAISDFRFTPNRQDVELCHGVARPATATTFKRLVSAS
jgi:hypothetical protein